MGRRGRGGRASAKGSRGRGRGSTAGTQKLVSNGRLDRKEEVGVLDRRRGVVENAEIPLAAARRGRPRNTQGQSVA